jgi:hypothetical protein
MAEAPFSRRQGYAGRAQEITIWEDAPESLRYFVLEAAREGGPQTKHHATDRLQRS